MALLYQGEIRPTKLVKVSACRFDDPAGAVGIEMMFVRVGDGPTYQAPLTYRDAPLAEAAQWLIGTCEHSVLGTRWVYDACGDPVYAATLAAAIFGGTGHAEEFIEIDGEPQRYPSQMTVTGSGVSGARIPVVGAVQRVADGDPTVIVTDSVELAVVRVVDGDRIQGGATLTGSWPGGPPDALLATARFND